MTLQRGGEGEVHDLFGIAHRILVASEQTGGAAAVVEITIPPGAGSVPHTDEREALAWYVIDGVVDFETEEGPLTLEPGGAVFMVRNSRHRFANTGDRPARALMVAVPGGIEAFFREAASALRTAPRTAPPSPEAIEAFAQVAGSYGIELHTESLPA
jgi:quercetin dioxygenase-like cupin family protein